MAQRLNFAIDKFGIRSNIFQVDQNGSSRTRLNAGPKIDAQPAISPDGSNLAFHSNRGGNYEIYINEPSLIAARQHAPNQKRQWSKICALSRYRHEINEK